MSRIFDYWFGKSGAPRSSDIWPSATDRVIQRPVHSGSMPEPALRKAIREVVEDRNSEPSATDSGSGPEFSRVVKDIDGRDMVLTDAADPISHWPLDPRLVGSDAKREVTLPPEVLAQLKRMETLLARIWREVAPSSESDVNTLLPDEYRGQ